MSGSTFTLRTVTRIVAICCGVSAFAAFTLNYFNTSEFTHGLSGFSIFFLWIVPIIFGALLISSGSHEISANSKIWRYAYRSLLFFLLADFIYGRVTNWLELDVGLLEYLFDENATTLNWYLGLAVMLAPAVILAYYLFQFGKAKPLSIRE